MHDEIETPPSAYLELPELPRKPLDPDERLPLLMLPTPPPPLLLELLADRRAGEEADDPPTEAAAATVGVALSEPSGGSLHSRPWSINRSMHRVAQLSFDRQMAARSSNEHTSLSALMRSL